MGVPSNWPQLIKDAGGIYAQIVANNDEPFESVITLKDVDYTGATFAGGIRAAYEADSAILKSFTFGTPTLDGSDTVVAFSLAETDVEALREGDDPGAVETLFYNIKVTPSGGAKRTYFAGEFLLMGA